MFKHYNQNPGNFTELQKQRKPHEPKFFRKKEYLWDQIYETKQWDPLSYNKKYKRLCRVQMEGKIEREKVINVNAQRLGGGIQNNAEKIFKKKILYCQYNY